MESVGMLGSGGFLRARRASIAVVGLGYWGPNLVRVLFERNDVQVRWMCDQDPSRTERLSRRYPGVNTTHSIDDVLADPLVDAVVLATPVNTHFELARRITSPRNTWCETLITPSAKCSRLPHSGMSAVESCAVSFSENQF